MVGVILIYHTGTAVESGGVGVHITLILEEDSATYYYYAVCGLALNARAAYMDTFRQEPFFTNQDDSNHGSSAGVSECQVSTYCIEPSKDLLSHY